MRKNHFSFAENQFFQMIYFLTSNETNLSKLSEVEEYLQEESRELQRNLLLGYLEKRGVGDVGPSVIGTDDLKRTHKRLRTIKIKT